MMVSNVFVNDHTCLVFFVLDLVSLNFKLMGIVPVERR